MDHFALIAATAFSCNIGGYIFLTPDCVFFTPLYFFDPLVYFFDPPSLFFHPSVFVVDPFHVYMRVLGARPPDSKRDIAKGIIFACMLFFQMYIHFHIQYMY